MQHTDPSNIYVSIMAGGVGSRFWPASRNARPKQFLDMLGIGKSLIRLTFERFQRIYQYIESQEEQISQNSPVELTGIDGNLFVDQQKASIVADNLEEVKKALQNLKLKLDKIRYSYQSL